MKNIYLIGIFLISILSCSKQDDKAQKRFTDKIWAIDSSTIMIPKGLAKTGKYKNGGEGVAYPSYDLVLRPQKDSTFNVYRDHELIYDKYYFNGDTLFFIRYESRDTLYYKY